MLIGDAGYGALFLLLAILLRKRLSQELRILIYVLSGATIAWGVITGTYFGSEQIAAIPFLQQLVIEEVASFGVDNISFMMHLSFVIGAAHLSVAHAIRAVRFSNSIKVLSELGWIAMVWGLFLLVEMLVLGKNMPGWAPWLFGGGFVLIAFFSQEDRNFLKSVGLSLANLPLSLINGFSDVVSYVRLFAVGMATAVVAASFNEMILPAGVEHSPWELIVAAFALALGHGLNVVLALMAVMVHGIRLNMLEFAGHLGMQFSGKAYNPFVLRSTYKDQLNTNEKQ
jgi:V/A-type H+-transporting ATPase subunit I